MNINTEMTKQMTMVNAYERAKLENSKYMVVFIKMPDLEKPELIINHKDNFESKINYYLKAYDKDLRLNHNKDIQIVNIAFIKDIDYLPEAIEISKHIKMKESE